MITPDNLNNLKPDHVTTMNVVEDYIDRQLKLQAAYNFIEPYVVIITGELYNAFKALDMPIVRKYRRFGWDVRDATGARKYMYVLEFARKV